MEVKILGSGCSKCNFLERRVRDVIAENNLQSIEVIKETDLNKLLDYGIMMTPALVINDEVKSSGKIPNDDELLTWLTGE